MTEEREAQKKTLQPIACSGTKRDRFILLLEIEAELALVAAKRELIPRFEKKIQATLARVWSEDESISA